MRHSLAYLASLSALALSACSSGGPPAGTTGTGTDPATCHATLGSCSTSADCCGTCFQGFCFPSDQGGKCVTTDDCATPYLCVGGVCKTASCRVDADVCTADSQCCAGHCRTNGTCGANRAPVAAAGPDATVQKGVSTQVGGISYDPDGDPLTYAWTLSGPPGSAAALSSPAAVHPTFVPDLAGAYVATLTVSDGQYTSTDSATITAVNAAPVASAGTSRTAPRNTLVQLDATGSTDPNGDPLTCAWTLAGPSGSAAALSSASDARPTFTPDLLGDYVATVTVSDGALTASASVTITATNTPPSPRITGVSSVNAGEPVTLSAASSTDQNGDPLTFTWSLTAPGGSAAVLSSATGATTGFTTDVASTYSVTLVASDGITTSSTSMTVRAYPHVTKLPHDVVAAAYARATDRLVTVSATPAYALWILDPATEVERRVDLAAGPPLSVGVSADGLVAVVGRNGGVTEVDLGTGAVLADCATRWSDGTTSWNYDAASVAVGPQVTVGTGSRATVTRFAYAAPGDAANRGDYTMWLDLSTCTQSADWILGMYFDGIAALRPGTGQFYVHDASYNEAFYVYAPGSGGGLATRTNVSPGYTMRRGFWFTEDGGRFVCEIGDVYASDPVPTTYSTTTDTFTRLGTLGDVDVVYGTKQLVLAADHSSARQELSIVPENDYLETTSDTVLKRYRAPDGTPSSYAASGTPVALPTIVVNGATYPGHGRYVFYRSDGSARYAIVRTDPAASVVQFAVAAMAP